MDRDAHAIPDGIATQIMIAGWAITQLALMLRYLTLRGQAPARRNPAALLFAVIQTGGLLLVALGPYELARDTTSEGALMQIGTVAALTALGILFIVMGLLALGQNFAAQAQVREEGHLVTSGPYAIVRNPIYLAYFLLTIAAGLALGHVRNLLIGGALYLVGAAFRILIEERVLREHFGAAYDDYAARAKRLIPFVW